MCHPLDMFAHISLSVLLLFIMLFSMLLFSSYPIGVTILLEPMLWLHSPVVIVPIIVILSCQWLYASPVIVRAIIIETINVRIC